MLISLRGTNGSGKTTVVRDLMKAAEKCAPIYGVLGVQKPEAYRLDMPGTATPLHIIGPYNVPTGGCDQITHWQTILDLIEKYKSRGHVLFEGVLIGGIWGRTGEILEKEPGSVLVYLDTPLEECIRRTRARRLGRGDERPFDPSNLTSKFHATVRTRVRAVELKMKVVEVSTEKAATAIAGLL